MDTSDREAVRRYLRVMVLLSKVCMLRTKYNFSVTSWWRTERRNEAVGGIPKSMHLTGDAIDLILDPGEDIEAFETDAAMLGIYVYNEGDHLHLYMKGGINVA